MNAQTDVNLTAIMEREEIGSIHRKRAIDDTWFFEVKLCDRTWPGYGLTVGEALTDAKARNAERQAA